MSRLTTALASGVAGAIATNVAHEIVRRATPLAPRVDLLGMQALAKMYRAVDAAPPTGRTLYVRTLIGDVISNTAYFSLAGAAGQRSRIAGLGLGVVAGIGAFFVPEHSDLDEITTARSTPTKLLVVGLYTLGGLVAGTLFAALEEKS